VAEFSDFMNFMEGLRRRVEMVGDALDNASDSSDPMKTVNKELGLEIENRLRPASVPLMDRGVAKQAIENKMLIEKAKDAEVLADALHEFIVKGKVDEQELE